MKHFRRIGIAFLFFAATQLSAQKQKNYTLSSPDKNLTVTITAGSQLNWSVTHGGQTILALSAIGLQLSTGEMLGKDAVPASAKEISVNETINTVAYKKDKVQNVYNQLRLTYKGAYGVVFRVYDNGVAYRFFTSRKDSLLVQKELSEFNFDKDYSSLIPHLGGLREGEKYSSSFEDFYTDVTLSQNNKDSLGYLPCMVKLDNNLKAVILEADAQEYPGMFVQPNENTKYGLKGVYAPYPLADRLGNPDNFRDDIVTKRADYIAKVAGTRSFPWRVIAISQQDKDLLNNDLVQCLSEPNKIENTTWIKPGKVAWDWWNDWNISHVDFKAGINTATYKYYIDFAAANHLEYIVLDEGWSAPLDMNQLNNEVSLPELVAYGKQKSVDLILWCTEHAISQDPEGLCKKFADMGIKGFKIDFLDRNDQKMVHFCYNIAAIAAKYHLVLDLHGVFPPQGLQRTWPNVLNFEAVRGLENMKWSDDARVPMFDATIPYIRMVAGPMDYTPGAMRNSTKGNMRINNSLPMSMGTRCRQMAMYIVFEAPLQMLCDNPTAYMKEPECTRFIAAVPTTFNETIALDGQVGEYIVIARKKDNAWYIGGMTNWTERDIIIDFSFLPAGTYTTEIFRDGINADRDATDYKTETLTINPTQKQAIHIAPGGGFAMRIVHL